MIYARKKEKDKPKERVREWKEAREWDGGGRDRERRKLEKNGRENGGGKEGKKGRKKEKEEGRKKSNNLRAFLHNDSITQAAKENQIAYEE